jgi:hypothetical protein
MNTVWLVAILGGLAAVFGALVWAATEMRKMRIAATPKPKTKEELDKAFTDIAEEDINHLFNKQFREELRNRGRLRFEKIIGENAMFLKHDLDMTIAQLNEYLQKEISRNLEAEFADYAKAMNDAQELALTSLRKTANEVEEQRVALSNALKADVAAREEQMLKLYEDNMAQIVEYYVLQTLGDQFDLKAQMPYILEQMENNKEAIIKDMRL